jgi:hypothetical protein
MNYGLKEWPIKYRWACHHTNWSTGRPAIYLLSKNSNLTGPSSDGTWTLRPQELRGRCNSLSSMNGTKKHIITPRFTKRGPKDGMTRGLRMSLPQEIRYYFLILGLNYSGIENFEANGKDHLR